MSTKIEVSPRKLPNLLSDLIEVAVVDLEKAEASRAHRVNMNVWHRPEVEGGNKCRVCFAGSVIAFTLGADPHMLYNPSDFDNATIKKLHALDWVRLGHINAALGTLQGATWPTPGELAKSDWPPIPVYDTDNPEPFKAALAGVVTALRERGL